MTETGDWERGLPLPLLHRLQAGAPSAASPEPLRAAPAANRPSAPPLRAPPAHAPPPTHSDLASSQIPAPPWADGCGPCTAAATVMATAAWEIVSVRTFVRTFFQYLYLHIYIAIRGRLS